MQNFPRGKKPDRNFNSKQKKDQLFFRRNHQIRVPEVLLITQTGENVGVKPIQIAQAMAQEAGLDLVEVGATATPPVCRILDYSKYMYEQKKKLRESKKKAKVKELKEFRFSPVIDIGDLTTKVRRAQDYLSKGHNVKITMQRKGRQSEELAQQTFAEILTKLEGYSTIEPEPKKEGRKIFITFKADGKTKKQENSTEKIEKDKS